VNKAAENRQSNTGRPWERQRGNVISNSTNAPDSNRTVVELAASMSPSPSASRQSNEFAAKANIAAIVRIAVRAADGAAPIAELL
jgi:hypothetical protein